MARRYVVVIHPDHEDGGYVASVPTVPGVWGQGETEEEAVQDAAEALSVTLDEMTARGEEIPPGDETAREVELAV